MVFKINTIGLSRFIPNTLNIKNSKKIVNKINKPDKTKGLPVVTIPLVVYMQSKTSQNNLDKHLTNEALKDTTNHPITDRTEKNMKALKKAGLNESEAKKHIDSNGYIDDDGKDICRDKGITSFKGAPEDGIDDSILASDPELARALRELQSIDSSLSPELQEYRDLPDFDNPRELLEYFIGDELPDDVILDWDLWSVLETMWEELLDIGDWL